MEERAGAASPALDADMEESRKPGEGTVCFSVEELDSLEDRQRERNKHTERKTHQRPSLVGYLYVTPETVPKIHRGEQLCVSSDLYTHRRKARRPGGSSRKGYRSPQLPVKDHIVDEASRPPKPQRYTGSSPKQSSEGESRVGPDHTPSNETDGTDALDSPGRAHTCGQCGDSFAERSLFLAHQRTHAKDFASTIHQGVQVSEQVVARLRHRRRIAYGPGAATERRTRAEAKSYACKECGKSFTQNASLVVHRRTHTGERPHTCAVCLKSFISGSYLVMHQRVHTGERPYACQDCGKRFISSSNLIIHQRVHTGEKPYLCTECGKCFGHSSHLVRHQKVHTGERPFSCAECGKSFSRSSHLVRHQTIHMRSAGGPAV